MSSTMRWSYVNTTQVVVHTTESPTTEEWEAFLADLGHRIGHVRSMFVYSLGGGPTTPQRSGFKRLLEESRVDPAIAVLTASDFVRGVVTAINWFKKTRIRLFTLDGRVEAADHLGLGPSERIEVWAALDDLRHQLGMR
jgi:hypothetical protein